MLEIQYTLPKGMVRFLTLIAGSFGGRNIFLERRELEDFISTQSILLIVNTQFLRPRVPLRLFDQMVF